MTNLTWQCVALGDDVACGDVHPIELDGVELAVWRDNEGKAHVWLDRCPHRGMRLSFGFVRGNRLTCLYHGWEYGTDGACKKIPAHPEMEPPQTLCTDVMPVAEAYGMIFVAGSWDHRPVDDGQWHGVRSVFVNASADKVHETLDVFAGQPLCAEGQVLMSRRQDLVLAVQRRGATACALHLSVATSDQDRRLQLARELVALRHKLNEQRVAA